MRKAALTKLAAAVSLAVGAAVVTPTQAATINFFFDPTGTGTFTGPALGAMDFLPGNALAIGAVPVGLAPTVFTLNAQSSLGSFIDPAGNAAIPLAALPGGAFTNELTYQGSFSESGVASGVNTATFTSLTGTFSVFFQTVGNANSITGGGYGDGTPVMSGTVNAGDISTFTTDPTKPLTLLDGFLADNQSGVQTVTGSGGGQISLSNITYNASYFAFDGNPAAFLLGLLFNTSFITPFNQTNPSDAVVGVVPRYTDAGGVAVNGLFPPAGTCRTETGGASAGPCDFHFQADANGSFTAAPEPGSLALIGIALAGLGFGFARRGARPQ